MKDPSTFNESILWDEEVRALAGRVELEAREMRTARWRKSRSSRREGVQAGGEGLEGRPEQSLHIRRDVREIQDLCVGVAFGRENRRGDCSVEKLEDERDAGTLALLLTPDASSETS